MQTTATSVPTSRRQFLAASSAAGAALAFPAILSARNSNDKLAIAIIGSGGRGGANMGGVAQTEYIAALCDVNQRNLDAAKVKHPQAASFTDFRKLFDHAKDYDAVVVSTCEHTHAFATMLALQTGKHVYCEKPSPTISTRRARSAKPPPPARSSPRRWASRFTRRKTTGAWSS